MIRQSLLLAAIFTVTMNVFAGEPSPIEDSNFFAESGRNRDDAVVQMNSFYLNGTAAWELTHEWALRDGSPRHQLSYTLPIFSEERSGFGDATLNYRYQLVGDADSRIGVAPRASLILPTRSTHFGTASSGLELALPVSISFGEHLQSHTNTNATWFKDRGETELKVTQNLTFAMHERFAFSVEAAYTHCVGGGELTVVRPGVQFSFAAPGGLTLSPGLAVPLGADGGLLFYLGVERSVSR
ncbi:MAG TPA: hypothetical protein VHW00_16630 [Thermoanaerobaculia bacterium]|nr:hypothetical protein [Thermoanaerobaculia bacterium]